MNKLDSKDKQILQILQSNGRITTSELATSVNLSDTPCLRRVKKLENEGVISGYQCNLNAKQIDLGVLVYAFVRLTANSDKHAYSFENQMKGLDHILECSVITGAHDYLLKIVAKDLESYEKFVKQSLGSLTEVASVESTVVLKQTFSRNNLPIV